MRLKLFFLLFANAFLSLNLQAQNVPIQAKPLLELLESVKSNDLSQFKNAFSQAILERSQSLNWSKNLEEGRQKLLSQFGNFEVHDFEFWFSGDEQTGKVLLYYQDQPQFSLAVVKENKRWKLNEH